MDGKTCEKALFKIYAAEKNYLDGYLFQKINNMHVSNLKITVFVLKNITSIPTRMAISKKCTSKLSKGKKEKAIIKIYVYFKYKLLFPPKFIYRQSIQLQ